MKRIGIVGGIGPEASIDYYRRIIDAFREQGYGLATPEIVLYNVNMAPLLPLFEAQELDQVIDSLSEAVELLEHAGVGFAAIASNTPHVVFDEIAARTSLPMLSIVDATCAAAASRGFEKLGLLGTGFTMAAGFYPAYFASHGLSIVVPPPEDQQLVQQRLETEIELGDFRDSTRQELIAIIDRMAATDDIDAVILGCTELPLILSDGDHELPFLNTTAIHVERIVAECLLENS